LSLRGAIRRPLAALLFAALAILVSWGVHRLLRARAAGAARMAPTDTLLYVEAPETGALMAAVRDSPVAARHERWLKSPLAVWLARRSHPAALALWREEGGSRLAWAVVSDARSGEESLLQALAGAQTPAGALPRRRHRGESYALLGRREGEALCAGRIGRHLVVASGEAAYRRLIDTAAGGASLAGSGRLQRGRRHLDGGGFLYAYLDGSLIGIPGSFAGAALEARLGPAGWMERFHLVGDPASPPLLLQLLRRSPCAPDLGAWLPAPADLLVSLCADHLETLYEPAIEALTRRGEAAESWKERLRGIEQLTGLDLKRDLLAALGQRHAAAFSWEPVPGSTDRARSLAPAIVAALEVERSSDLQRVLDRLSGFGRATGRLRVERRRGRELTILEDAAGSPSLAWVLGEGRWLVAREPKRIEEALAARDAGKTLADSDWRGLARRLAPAEMNLLAILRSEPSPTLLWAAGRRDGIHGELHSPHGVILVRGAKALEALPEAQNPRAK
jgi:hypothetical protein